MLHSLIVTLHHLVNLLPCLIDLLPFLIDHYARREGALTLDFGGSSAMGYPQR